MISLKQSLATLNNDVQKLSNIAIENHTGIVETKDSLSKIKLQTEQILKNAHKNVDELQVVTAHVEHTQQNHDKLVNNLSHADHSLQDLTTSLDWLVHQEKKSAQIALVLPTSLQAPEKRSRRD